MSERILTTEMVLNEWGTFSLRSTGKLFPINYLGQDDNLTLLGHEVDNCAPPITCIDGIVVRRLVLSFNIGKDEVRWS